MSEPDRVTSAQTSFPYPDYKEDIIANSASLPMLSPAVVTVEKARIRSSTSPGIADAPELPSSKVTATEKWKHMYYQLLDYKAEHDGSCLVPNRFKKNPQLGSWVSAQRRQYKQYTNGEITPMTSERISLLETIGFKWATRDPRHVPWEVRYQELCRYKQQVGNCMVPIGFKKNKQLSNWVSTQRQEMKLMKQGRPSRLTEERTLRLNDIGFVWEAQRGGAKPKKKAAEEERHKSASTLIGPVVTIKTLLSCGCSPLLSSAVPFPSAPREPISNESTLWSIKQRSHHVTDVGMYLSRGYSTNCCCVAELGEDALDTDQYTVCSHQGCTTNIKTPSGALTIDPTINPCNSVCQNSDRRQPTEGQQGIFDDAEEAEDLRADMAIQAYLKNKRRYKDGIFTSDNSQTPALYQPKTMNSRNSWENSLLPADMVDRSDTVGGVVMKAGHASSCSKASLAVSVGVGDRVDHNNASMYRPNHNSDRVRREVAATLLSVSGGKANFSKH